MTVTHLHFTGWPDHGVPDNVMSLISFIRHVRSLHPVSQEEPLLVHCSAGVGRTGTFILLDIIMQQIKAERCIGIYHTLSMMRMQKMKLVQTRVSVLSLPIMFPSPCLHPFRDGLGTRIHAVIYNIVTQCMLMSQLYIMSIAATV